MTVLLKEEQRRLLPRWRESEVAVQLPETLPLPGAPRAVPAVDTRILDAQLAEWRAAPGVATAADVVASGFVLGCNEHVREPAEYLLANATNAAQPAVAIAQRVLGLQTEAAPAATHRVAVAGLRARLIATPRDPLAYLDLARRYAALGHSTAAERAVRSGLALAPESRFILRSASRFFVHIRDPERAHDLLRRAGRTRSDPWLLAAEISAATVAGRTSRLVKAGRGMTSAARLPPIHLSELAGSLGTLELQAGNRRRARKLFAQALIAPTDNTLAQAEWAAPALDGPTHSAALVARAFEARALAALRESAWDVVVAACFEWLDDEPFSHKSAVLGSFAAATGLGDYAQALLLAQTGLIANPHDQTLRNNVVYTLGMMGRTREAAAEARLAEVALIDENTRIAWQATNGLLNYRLGNGMLGQQQYEAAIAAATQKGLNVVAAVAALNWALVTAEIGDAAARDAAAIALDLADRSPTPPVVALRKRLLTSGT